MDFIKKLTALKDAGLYRQRRTISTAQEREVILDGKKVLLFSSNNYLGIGAESFFVQHVVEAIGVYGTGAGGSRLTTGNSALHMDLESTLAQFKKTEACLTFTSGYTANVGTVSAIGDTETVIFSDALNHASLIDGCRLARGRVVIYAHGDVDDLLLKIREHRPQKGLLVTDSVFSMDGDLAPMSELVEIAHEHDMLLMVDDAHATGVLGATGRGSLEHFALGAQAVDVLMGTLSKALSSEGGFVCGSEALCDYLRHTARSFVYTTAPSPGNVAASLAALEYLDTHPERVQQLQKNNAYFADALNALGIHANAETPIFPVLIGNEEEAMRISDVFLQQDIFVPCIRYPTVAKGKARLRFTLMATHTRQDIDRVLDVLKECIQRYEKCFYM